MHMIIAIRIAYLLSGSWRVAIAIGLIEPCVQTIAYFFHEQAWHKIEHKTNKNNDIHNEVINSISPISETMEKIIDNQKND